MIYDYHEIREIIEQKTMKYLRNTEQQVAIKAQGASELHEIRHTAGKLIGAGEIISAILNDLASREKEDAN